MNETQIGQLVIDLKIKTEALEKGLETAKKKIQEIENQNEQLENSNKQLDASFLALSATAIVALAKISGAIKDCVNEYNSYTQAMSSLQNVSEYTEQSMQDLSKIMNKFSNYMTKSDIATTIKNFSLMGMTAQETEKMIEALTNSAIRNRNANYTVSEAVRVASEGYRQGLSTLSDSAGVTENLSVMLDKYAKSIGKTASQLTETEKNQAYLNRTMYAAEPFANAMADYMDTLAGKQGEYSQSMRETQVAYTEALEPTLMKLEEMKSNAIKTLGDLISNNKSATVGVTTFGIAILGLGTILTVGIKGVQMYKTAIDALNISTMALKTTMTGMLVFSAVVAGIAAITNAVKENEEAQAKLNETTKMYEEIKNGAYAYTDSNIAKLKDDKTAIEEQIALTEKYLEIQKQIDEINERSKDDTKTSPTGYWYSDEDLKSIENLRKQLKEAGNQLNEARKRTQDYGHSLNELKDKLKTNTKGLAEANAIKQITNGLDTEEIKKQQKEAAQLKINAQSMQNYLNVIKKGEKSTQEYQEALKILAKVYPEAANAEGILIDKAQDFINEEQLKADTAWKSSQDMIQSYIDMLNAAIESEAVQKQVANNIGIAFEDVKPKLQSVVSILKEMAGYSPIDVPNITPTSISRKSYSSKSYSNKRLDNYKKEIEYKKSLDQLNLQQEIAMYQTALKKYAKTTDEKRELEVKIYELQKELQQQDLDNYISSIEHKKSLDKISIQEEIKLYEQAYNELAKTTEQKEELEVTLYELRKELAQKERDLLNEQTNDYENFIKDQQNLRGAEYDVKERKADLDKLIKTHQEYLNQILKDERYSLDERKQIYREELQTIRDYEQQKRDLRVGAIDDTVNQLTNAIKKQNQEMQKADKEAINKNLELVKKWKEARIEAINEEYDARIKAIQDELDALDKAEQQKSRDEEDSEYERKRNRLQDLIDYEHDAVTKANYQKELDKLVSEYQKTLDKRALEDRKEALNAQKDLLKEEQSNKVQSIEDEAEKQTEIYNKQLEDLNEYYNKQIDMAQETAEKMLLNVQQNQDKIIDLLNKYGDKYEITGQSLGEKLAQGINDGLANKIENIIQTIQDRIDGAIENQISKWASASYKYEAGMNKPQTSSIVINQTNNIEQNPEMPSETYRKLRNIDEELAASLAGM